METYLYIFRPIRPAFMEALTAEENKIMDLHFDYLKAASKEKTVVMAGPCVDRSLGIVVFLAQDMKSAQVFMQNDPAVKYNVMQAELKQFRIALHNCERVL